MTRYSISGITLLCILSMMIITGCSGSEEKSRLNAFISGKITVDEELESSGDFSDIELLITIPSTTREAQDTIFYAVTDSTGFFEGSAHFHESDLYQMVVRRNRNIFGIQGLVLADSDTITFTAELPDVGSTAELSSSENEIFRTLERVDRNFNRVVQFINAGAISADSVEIELAKWSDIYWDVYERYPGTYASMVAGNSSVSIASGWNDSLMVERSGIVLETEGFLRPSTRSVLASYYAETGGIDEVLSFLNRLESLADSDNRKMEIRIDRIELLYDSSMTLQANQYLQQFRQAHSDNPVAMQWAENKSYDLEFLTPGSEFPAFSIMTLQGDSLSAESLTGSPYLLEITRLDNPLYQQQYERTVAIHQIYSNFGLKIITVPLAAGSVALQAFYDERGLLWDVANPGSFAADSLIERFNVNQVPTRFLVNDNGELVRRYVGNEYDDIVRGLQLIITQNDQQ